MGVRVELTDGHWAEFFEPKRVPQRRRQPLVEAILEIKKVVPDEDMKAVAEQVTQKGAESVAADALPTDALPAVFNLQAVLVYALVSSWSFTTPVTLDAVLDLAGEDFDLLGAAAEPLMADVIPDFSPTPPGTESPTPPSGA